MHLNFHDIAIVGGRPKPRRSSTSISPLLDQCYEGRQSYDLDAMKRNVP